jgi:hypothetical protein
MVYLFKLIQIVARNSFFFKFCWQKIMFLPKKMKNKKINLLHK